MGLRRLYWIPQGASPAEGAYVRYPFATMLAILALESHRQQALVIGEDLGTVPAGFRPVLQKSGILSYRVLYFERRPNGSFHPPERYPATAVAAVSTHDLPTLHGWLTGNDLDWRERLGLYPDAEAAKDARAQRADEQTRLFRALRRAGLLDGGRPGYEALSLAAHRFLARTPAALLLVQLEELEGLVEQANLPGTVDEHPNWRRRTQGTLAELLESPFARALLAALKEERPRG
jgi:4-alpha-glucanotransferase